LLALGNVSAVEGILACLHHKSNIYLSRIRNKTRRTILKKRNICISEACRTKTTERNCGERLQWQTNGLLSQPPVAAAFNTHPIYRLPLNEALTRTLRHDPAILSTGETLSGASRGFLIAGRPADYYLITKQDTPILSKREPPASA
jgi:hypothetical protein